jgi:hypothetical protein
MPIARDSSPACWRICAHMVGVLAHGAGQLLHRRGGLFQRAGLLLGAARQVMVAYISMGSHFDGVTHFDGVRSDIRTFRWGQV